MKIYLAHNFQAREWLKTYIVPALKAFEHEITSTWLNTKITHTRDTHELHAEANLDLEDLERASIVIFFAEQYGPTPGRGKYVELGYALAKNKAVVIVGTRKENDCIFYHLRGIQKFATTDDMLLGIERIGRKERI